ncbi:MAG: hypothetical protein WC783_00805 [Candidatus Paceibacterota bacterium]|jgi:hypothetical protein
MEKNEKFIALETSLNPKLESLEKFYNESLEFILKFSIPIFEKEPLTTYVLFYKYLEVAHDQKRKIQGSKSNLNINYTTVKNTVKSLKNYYKILYNELYNRPEFESLNNATRESKVTFLLTNEALYINTWSNLFNNYETLINLYEGKIKDLRDFVYDLKAYWRIYSEKNEFENVTPINYKGDERAFDDMLELINPKQPKETV